MKEAAQKILDEVSKEKKHLKIKKKKGKTVKLDKKLGGAELVKEAVSDLDREINKIRKNKSGLNSELRNLDQSLDNAKQLEKKLQAKITNLESQELDLVDKKKSLKQKNDSLSERLSKVKAIKNQLSEV